MKPLDDLVAILRQVRRMRAAAEAHILGKPFNSEASLHLDRLDALETELAEWIVHRYRSERPA
jgi:hypothetical protein